MNHPGDLEKKAVDLTFSNQKTNLRIEQLLRFVVLLFDDLEHGKERLNVAYVAHLVDKLLLLGRRGINALEDVMLGIVQSAEQRILSRLLPQILRIATVMISEM